MGSWGTVCETIPAPLTLLIGLALGLGIGTLLGFGMGLIVGSLSYRVYHALRRALPAILRLIYAQEQDKE